MKHGTLSSCMVLLAVVGITLAVCCCESLAGQTAWRGKIVDIRTGKPVPGVTVYAGQKGRVDLGEGVSRSNGEFVAKYPEASSRRLAEKKLDYYLYVQPTKKDLQTYLRQTYRMRPLKEHVTVKLVPFHVHIKGRVLDESGKPITDAQVTVMAPGRSVVSVKTDSKGLFTVKPLPAFARLSPYYRGANAVPEAFRRPGAKVLDEIFYSVKVKAKGYQSLAPVYDVGKKPRRFTKNLPLVSSVTDAIYTWVDVRLPKYESRKSVDIVKHCVVKMRGIKRPRKRLALKGGKRTVPDRKKRTRTTSAKPTRIVDVWNRSACRPTYTVRFELKEAADVEKIVIWHNWRRSEKLLKFSLKKGKEVVRSGSFKRGASDPNQKNWAEGVIRVGETLPAGKYKLRIATGRAAKNSAAPKGFVRVYASPAAAESDDDSDTGADGAADADSEENAWGDSKRDTKKGPKKDTKSDSKADAKKGAKADSKTDSQTRSKSGSKSSAKGDSKKTAGKSDPARPPVDIPGSPNSPAVAMDYSHEKNTVATTDTADECVDKSGKVVRDPGSSRDKHGIVKVYYADVDYYQKARRKRRKDPRPFTGLLTSGSWDCPLQDGRKHGVETVWYVDNPRNGVDPKRLSVKSNTTWRNGVRHGLSKQNHRNGKLKTRYTYVNGVTQGPAYSFHKNGKIKREWTEKDGKIHGVLRIYSLKGEVEEVMYHEGKRQ